ncbi:hypothetical protein LCGC14_1943660, partial [marine sediment metagenome]
MALSIFDTGGISIFGNVFDTIDLNGTELILDADGDSSITIDTDDQFDLKLGGSDIMSISNDGTKTTLMGLAGDYWRIGDNAVTGHNLNSEDDLMVTGEFEVKVDSFLPLRSWVRDLLTKVRGFEKEEVKYKLAIEAYKALV